MVTSLRKSLGDVNSAAQAAVANLDTIEGMVEQVTRVRKKVQHVHIRTNTSYRYTLISSFFSKSHPHRPALSGKTCSINTLFIQMYLMCALYMRVTLLQNTANPFFLCGHSFVLLRVFCLYVTYSPFLGASWIDGSRATSIDSTVVVIQYTPEYLIYNDCCQCFLDGWRSWLHG